jgi:hypothetical protein
MREARQFPSIAITLPQKTGEGGAAMARRGKRKISMRKTKDVLKLIWLNGFLAGQAPERDHLHVELHLLRRHVTPQRRWSIFAIRQRLLLRGSPSLFIRLHSPPEA